MRDGSISKNGRTAPAGNAKAGGADKQEAARIGKCNRLYLLSFFSADDLCRILCRYEYRMAHRVDCGGLFDFCGWDGVLPEAGA